MPIRQDAHTTVFGVVAAPAPLRAAPVGGGRASVSGAAAAGAVGRHHPLQQVFGAARLAGGQRGGGGHERKCGSRQPALHR